MVKVHDAIETAMDYLKSFYKPNLTNRARLEEVELVESRRATSPSVWLITISLPDPDSVSYGPGSPRIYKTISVRQKDGQPMSMKIRQPIVA